MQEMFLLHEHVDGVFILRIDARGTSSSETFHEDSIVAICKSPADALLMISAINTEKLPVGTRPLDGRAVTLELEK